MKEKVYFGEKSEELLFELGKIINNYVLKRLSKIIWHANRQPLPKDLSYQE